jgi:hypothetical protein
MIVLPKTDQNGATVESSDFLEGDRIGLKQPSGSAAVYIIEDAFNFGDHIRINVSSNVTLGAAGDQAYTESEVSAVFEDNAVTRAAATAGFTAASDARTILQGLIDALEARADTLELDPTTQTAVNTINTALSARLDTLEADPTTATAVAAGDATTLASANTYTDTSITNLVNGADAALDTLKEIGDALAQGDTDVTTALTTQITTEATTRGNADTALSGRLDVLEADPTTATAVAAVQTDVDANEASRKTYFDWDSNITKVINPVRGTGINVGNNIEMIPAAAGGRVEITGDLVLDASDLTDAADDTAAAAAGVIVGQIYHNSGALRVRLS